MTGNLTALITVFVVAGILVTVLGYRQFYRFTTQPAWVASSDLSIGDVIDTGSLKKIRTRVRDDVINNPTSLVGAILRVDKDEGEAFYSGDLASPPKSFLAQAVPEGRVLYTLTPKSPSIPYQQVRKGDRIDVLAKGRGGVRMVARNVLMMGVLRPPNNKNGKRSGRSLLTALAELPESNNNKGLKGTPLILAVKPEDVYPLASIGESEIVSVVLHGEAELRKGELLEIKPTITRREVEILEGLEKSRVKVKL